MITRNDIRREFIIGILATGIAMPDKEILSNGNDLQPIISVKAIAKTTKIRTIPQQMWLNHNAETLVRNEEKTLKFLKEMECTKYNTLYTTIAAN